MKKKPFSLIEMMTVITVILVLSVLAIPSLNSVRKKARSTICATQMKQLGTLIATYANDNDGYLPYTNNNLYNNPGSYSYLDKPNFGKLYGSWSGHLLPYLNVELESWNRHRFRYDPLTEDIEKPGGAIADENYYNWKLMQNMFFEGGHGSLKLFICPESTTTYDARQLLAGNFIPRIAGMGSDRIGLPSSYMANGNLFGNLAKQSKRLEDVSKNNFLLVEGNRIHSANSYQKNFSVMTYYGGSINTVIGGWGYSKSVQNPTQPPRSMGFSFMHDDTEEVWYSHHGKSWARLTISSVNRYNKIFNPVAAAFYVWDRPEGREGSLASNQYPGEKWGNFETSFTQNNDYKIYRYYGKDSGISSYFGNMNFLSADLSVRKSHIAWMYENGRSLGIDTN